MSDDEYQRARTIAIRLLSRREQSRSELIRRLISRDIGNECAEHLLDQLAEQDWQSDQRFCENLFETRRNKGYGPIRIRAELEQHRIDPGLIDEVTAQSADEWLERLEQLYRKKYREPVIDSAKERAKRSRFLNQRGFSSEQIQKLFSNLKNVE